MKRFYRSRQSKIFAGVCGGLGDYTGVDPIFWRLAFVFLGPFTPAILIYLILWLVTNKEPNNI